MTPTITKDEWLNALASIKPTASRCGVTTRELTAKWEVKIGQASERIGLLIRAGKVEFAGYNIEVNRIGRPQRIPAYRMKRGKK